jgi:hypothetical protein
MKQFFLRVMAALSLLHVDENSKRFIKHNNVLWSKWRNSHVDAVILTEFHDMNETIIASSYFLNILARKYNAKIRSFSPKRLYHHRAKHKIYRSFNTSGHVVTKLTKEQILRKSSLIEGILPTLKTKQDLFDLIVFDVWIGVDIYESYLRELGEATVDLNDSRLHSMVERGVALLIFWMDYFSCNNVVGIIVSHDCYLDLDIPCKIAYLKSVPVYLPDCTGATYAKKPFSVHSNYSTFKSRFDQLPLAKQSEARAISKIQLERRLGGEVGVNMAYSLESAFSPVKSKKRVLKESVNTKVLISSHCFYDNPHSLGGMLFLDFLEWLCFLGEISKETDYDWYIKMHPDALPGTLEIIEDIFKSYPKIIILPKNTSHIQLVDEGIDFVLTVYGTVGIEYPLMGIPVINAAFNSRVSFDFNWHPKSIDEYKEYLYNLKSLHKDINLDEVYECYYMLNFYEKLDDLVFISHKKLMSELTSKQLRGTEPFNFFLNYFSLENHNKTINIYSDFINSGKQHLFENGPEDD